MERRVRTLITDGIRIWNDDCRAENFLCCNN